MLKVDELLLGVKPNGLAGRPTKSVAALKRQPVASIHDSLLNAKPIAIVGQDFSQSKKRGTKRPTGKQYIGRKVAKYFSSGLSTGTVTSSKIAKGGQKALIYRILYYDGYTEDLTDMNLTDIEL